MKHNTKVVLFVIFISITFFFGCQDTLDNSGSSSCNAEGFEKNPQLKIESLEPVKINGIDQWILIRGKDLSNPVLLHLHGGPGFSAIPVAHVVGNKLEDKFIVVNWDQRGAGLSYNENIPRETMNMSQFIEDTREVTEYLKNKFHKDKIYLLGHSWGSVLGISVVHKYPEDYYAYIGCGQVVSEKLSKQEIRKWLTKQFAKTGNANNKKYMDLLLRDPGSRAGIIGMYGGQIHKHIDRYKIESSSPYFSYYHEKVGSSNRYRGNILSKPLEDECMKNFDLIKNVKEIKIPVYFFCGRYDYITPTKPVKDYYKILKAPYKEIVWFEESAHFMAIEEPGKYQNTIMKIAEKYSGI